MKLNLGSVRFRAGVAGVLGSLLLVTALAFQNCGSPSGYEYENQESASSGTPTQSKACLFNNAPVANKAWVAAFAAATVPFGQDCLAETNFQKRWCENGSLSGSFQHSKCEVAAANACVLKSGIVVAHGETRQFCSTPSVSSGSTCSCAPRTCNNGVLSSGDFLIYPSCQVLPPTACQTADGVMVAPGTPVYAQRTVPFGQTCVATAAVCSGSQVAGGAHSQCSVAPPTSCRTADGVNIAHGNNISLFQAASMPLPMGSSCNAVLSQCNNGGFVALSGGVNLYQSGLSLFSQCSVQNASGCVYNGEMVPSGGTRDFYRVPIVYRTVRGGLFNCASGTNRTTKTCVNGSWSGAAEYPYSTCEVELLPGGNVLVQ